MTTSQTFPQVIETATGRRMALIFWCPSYAVVRDDRGERVVPVESLRAA